MFENKKGKIARQLFIILGLVGLIIKKVVVVRVSRTLFNRTSDQSIGRSWCVASIP